MREGFYERDGQLYGYGEGGKDGPKFSAYWERLRFELREVRRLALNESEYRSSMDGPPDEAPTLMPKRSVIAHAVFPDDSPARLHHFNFGGAERYSGRIKADIHEGPEAHAMLWYWPESEREDRHHDGEGMFHLSLYLVPDHMDWLWKELRERPGAKVELDICTYVYQYDYERFLSEPYHRQDYYLARDEKGNVRSEGHLVGMRVRDREPDTVSEVDEFGEVVETPKIDPEFLKPPMPSQFENRVTLLLRVVIGLLVALAVIMWFKQ